MDIARIFFALVQSVGRRFPIPPEESRTVKLVVNRLAGFSVDWAGQVRSFDCTQHMWHLAVGGREKITDIFLDFAFKDGTHQFQHQNLFRAGLRGVGHKNDHVDILDGIHSAVHQLLANLGVYTSVATHVPNLAVSGNVDNSQREGNPESIQAIDVVDCDPSRRRMFLDQLEPEIVVPLDVEDVIDQGID